MAVPDPPTAVSSSTTLDPEIIATTPQHPEDGDTVDYGYFWSTDLEEIEIYETAEHWENYQKKGKLACVLPYPYWRSTPSEIPDR